MFRCLQLAARLATSLNEEEQPKTTTRSSVGRANIGEPPFAGERISIMRRNLESMENERGKRS
jgi:hypothetical protein